MGSERNNLGGGVGPCIVGVANHTWREDAPEPLDMWARVAREAAADAGSSVLTAVDALDVVFTQTWQYDDPAGRVAERLGITPRRARYSGIGGTTPQVLVQDAVTRILDGESEVALVCGAEALATQRRWRKAGERFPYSFKPAEKRPFPWEAPFHPAEVAHDVFQAWLTFAMFDNARRARLGVGLDEYRAQLGAQWARFTDVAAANPDAWFRTRRTAEEIITPTADNRMVGYPYTKYMVSIMDVDMAAAVVIASDDAADRLGVPRDRRVYLRGWAYATDPVYVAEHPDLARSPAMEWASQAALAGAGVGIDEVAHLDLYSCFASSVNLARDALGLEPDDPRGFTVTGGLPYHGGAGSDYLAHSIATMVRVLRKDPRAFGLVSGVGMHMTKHVFGVYSATPGAVTPPEASPDPVTVPIVERHEGPATVAAYTVVHGSDGAPDWGVAVCDVAGGRCYARFDDPGVMAEAERCELVGRPVSVVTDGTVNRLA
ncbi:MAG TPA: acetyl-CoA acetyltransferase [Acidimicrobiia bacterium]|nr:acetyl-CoA acetyltransferase [Acidimicrobiia bacterium]